MPNVSNLNKMNIILPNGAPSAVGIVAFYPSAPGGAVIQHVQSGFNPATGNGVGAFDLDISTNPASTQMAIANARQVGSINWDPTLPWSLKATSTVKLRAFISTSNASNAAFAALVQLTGAGSPQTIVTLTTTSLITVEVTSDVSSLFQAGGSAAAGVYAINVYLNTSNGADWATCAGARLEFQI